MLAITRLLTSVNCSVRKFAADRRGNVAVATALALPALMGAFGLGTEVASWYSGQRSMQNAADAAALAAATNAGNDYATEAKAVTAQYGFKDGANGVAVAVANTATCPAGGANCYSVTITKSQALILSQFVGFRGDATLAGGAPAKRILATAVATQGTVKRPYCLVALGQSGTTLRTNGAPTSDLSGCNLMSNGDATCNGHNTRADNGDAHGVNRGCGVTRRSNLPVMADPYSGLASNIPSDPCNGSWQEAPTKKKGTPLQAPNLLSGNFLWSGNVTRCGDLQLTADVTVTNTNGPATLVIYNGDLDLNGHTLSTSPGSQLSIVFAGDNSHSHIPMGGGRLDIEAPKSGAWSGVAMYQAPNLTSGVDISAAGNTPTWDITGLVYLPHASVTFSGAVNKSSNGSSCFVMVADNVTINGTGSILAHGGCTKAGLTMPSADVPGRGKLVS